ncbi:MULTISPECIES: sensor histidine kinase [Amycolatopsis]|uniref:histidine kinase n=2 Tax=Amycolatopsis TaxID=1813 RepID=A0A1I3P381_9PSEU|nr:histidine kinase [Amycolatopsis sacchari]SFJ15889.1 Signal transduction histidine kinase [Amycolatopsis sacchari]
MNHVGRAARITVGLALGGLAAFAEAVFVVLAVPSLAVRAVRPRVFAAARALAEVDRRRLARWYGSENADDYRGERALRYLSVRCVLGGIGAGIFVLIALGGTSIGIMLWQVATGRPLGGGDPIGRDHDWYDGLAVLLLGTVLLFVALQGLAGVVSFERRLARYFFGPSQRELLQRRVTALAESRAEVLAAVDEERRRIERDIHDGVQQRLVALGILLGRARRAKDSTRSDELLRQAHEEATWALEDLREVAWRVYPVALASEGLPAALESLAERAGLPVDLRCEVGSLPAAVETAAYFVVSEAVTNAVKHADASRIAVSVLEESGSVHVEVVDDGFGGAHLGGGGLSGLARRVAGVEGEFTVDSPEGGPTRIGAVLPCA